jgi:hypothetical protein
MRKFVAAAGAVLALGIAAPEPAQAQPGGCLKYGLGGAIIGHFAGGHRLKGAALGCALGVIRRRSESRAQYNERLRREELRQRREYEDDPVARRQRRNQDEDTVVRRPRRDYDPDDTGALRQRRDRERETVY